MLFKEIRKNASCEVRSNLEQQHDKRKFCVEHSEDQFWIPWTLKYILLFKISELSPSQKRDTGMGLVFLQKKGMVILLKLSILLLAAV